MAWCLMAPSYYLDQCWPVRFSDIHLRAISQGILQPSITKMGFKIAYFKFHPNFPGANQVSPVETYTSSNLVIIGSGIGIICHIRTEPKQSCRQLETPLNEHYGDVKMGAIVSQITSLTIVYSTVYLDADQRKHQSSASLAFVRGIHRGPVNSPHKWLVTRKMFPFDDVIIRTKIELSSIRNTPEWNLIEDADI